MKKIVKQVQVIDENAIELTVKAVFVVGVETSLDTSPHELEHIKAIEVNGRILEKMEYLDEEQFHDDVTGKIYKYTK